MLKTILPFWSLGNCRGSRVRGRGSEVEGRKSRVACRGSPVEGRKSRVASRGSHVEGHRSRVRKSRSRVKSKGSKFKCLYISYRPKERSIFVGTCWLNTKA